MLGDGRRVVRPVTLDTVVELMRALTTRQFCSVVLRHVNVWLRVDHCALVRLTNAAGVQLFGAEALTSFVAAGARAIASYVARFHRLDPVRRLLQGSESLATIVTQRQRCADLDDSTHRRACYDEPGIVDRLSLAMPDGRRGLVMLVLHRHASSGEFSDDERATLDAVAPLLATACARHVELLMHAGSDAPTWRVRLASAQPEMTVRELDVAASLLAGRTMRETASLLGIAQSSVVTYSERAYGRLAVANLRELRARFADAPGTIERAPRSTLHLAWPTGRPSALHASSSVHRSPKALGNAA